MKVHASGYGLVEVMLSVIILAIVATITLPNLTYFLAQNRLENTLNRVFRGLYYARGYAVTNSSYVTICPLESGSCTDNWHEDIYIFEDANSSLSLDTGEFVIRVTDQVDPRDTLTYPRKAITYRPDGSISFMQSGSFIYCNVQYPELRGNRLTVSQVGRIRIRDSDKCIKISE